ncbi:MAG: UDP-3-O-(3-hydroxymyristoyl)glucosamine N-acyltransferase [Saprospiraceae bacterium]|nr:UDP-3-O-(3-hydroxymyristoyl)glucosamine N-acyltransferase [Saprospiraceae bacterium]MCB9325269.1 UDP-3-O-(3-hydroxymyristoyl)glucosamine N-acyltransferase [Lewinellaceae bacterium]
MTFDQPIPVKEIAQKIGARIIGNADLMAMGINEIHNVREGDITFVDVQKYFSKSLNSAATIIILNEETQCPEGKALLVCDAPFKAYNSIVIQHNPFEPLNHTIGETAQIHPSTIVEPGAVIGPEVKIGKNCLIQSNAVIRGRVIIKDHVLVESGSIIGTDAFYYKKTTEGLQKWRSGGRVIIEDHVDVGANSTVNMGVSGDTILGEGTKLDCMVHIGHDVVVGKHCQITAQVAIGGNTRIGNRVVIYGQVGIIQNLTIGDDVVVMAKSMVSKDLEAGKSYYGNPADEARTIYKQMAALRQLPELLQKLRKKV